jgi:protein SCO1
MMKQKIHVRKIDWKSSSLIFWILIVLFSSCQSSSHNKANDVEVNAKPKLLLSVFGESALGANGDTLYHTIQDFSFVNQFDDTITEQTIKNKIYVADFFFATCQSICPKMSAQLTRLQKEFVSDSNFVIVSHTVNPEYDNVKILNEYGQGYGAIRNKWHLMTGEQKAIYNLAKTSYLVNALEDDGSEQGFLHSETFLLIDTQRRIRGIYDGTDSTDVSRLIREVNILKTEK